MVHEADPNGSNAGSYRNLPEEIIETASRENGGIIRESDAHDLVAVWTQDEWGEQFRVYDSVTGEEFATIECDTAAVNHRIVEYFNDLQQQRKEAGESAYYDSPGRTDD